MIKKIEHDLLHDSYAQIYDIIEDDAVILKIHHLMGGQQVNLPEHLYDKSKVTARIKSEAQTGALDVNAAASKYGYSRPWIRRILRDVRQSLSDY